MIRVYLPVINPIEKAAQSCPSMRHSLLDEDHRRVNTSHSGQSWHMEMLKFSLDLTLSIRVTA